MWRFIVRVTREFIHHDSLPGFDPVQDSFDARLGIKKEKVPQNSIGLVFDRSLTVQAVREKGLVPKWNRDNPETAVRVFDRVVAVNGRMKPILMVHELKQAGLIEGSTLTFVFERVGRGAERVMLERDDKGAAADLGFFLDKQIASRKSAPACFSTGMD
jgi:hypothetical protein